MDDIIFPYTMRVDDGNESIGRAPNLASLLDDEYYSRFEYIDCSVTEKFVDWMNRELDREGINARVNSHNSDYYNIDYITFNDRESYMMLMMRYG